MASRPTVQVEGARQLRAALKRAGVDVQDLKDAHAAVADLVRRTAAASPTQPHRTGALATTLRSSGTKAGAVVRLGGFGVRYAGPIHWGWPARHIAAQPWVAAAAEDSQPSWEQQYLDAVDAILATIEGTTTP